LIIVYLLFRGVAMIGL